MNDAIRLWDKDLCREMGRISNLRRSRKSLIYYVNKYKELVRRERDSR